MQCQRILTYSWLTNASFEQPLTPIVSGGWTTFPGTWYTLSEDYGTALAFDVFERTTAWSTDGTHALRLLLSATRIGPAGTSNVRVAAINGATWTDGTFPHGMWSVDSAQTYTFSADFYGVTNVDWISDLAGCFMGIAWYESTGQHLSDSTNGQGNPDHVVDGSTVHLSVSASPPGDAIWAVPFVGLLIPINYGGGQSEVYVDNAGFGPPP